MAAVFADGLIPCPKHLCQKTFGRLLRLISRLVAHRQKADGSTSTTVRLDRHPVRPKNWNALGESAA
jgi:hypothetical protein